MATRQLLYFRVLPGQDVFTLRPGFQAVYEDIPVRINSQGFREAERAIQKPDDEQRILVMGDSVVFGWELHLEDTVTKQLGTLLEDQTGKNFDVINAGIPGWNMKTEQIYLQNFGLAYKPDLVIAYFTALNDVNIASDACPTIIFNSRSPVHQWTSENIVATTFLPNMFRQFLEQKELSQPVDPGSTEAPVYPFPTDPEEATWERCVRSPIREIKSLLQQQHIPLLIVIAPTDLQVRSQDYPTTPQQVITKLAHEQNLPTVDLLPLFREKYESNPASTESDSDNPLFADYYSHPSRLGNMISAEAISNALHRHGLLQPSDFSMNKGF